MSIEDDRSVVLVRWYREANSNGGLLAVEQNHKSAKMYKWDLRNDGYQFEWITARAAMCNVQMTKMNRGDPRFINMFSLADHDKKAMFDAFTEWKAKEKEAANKKNK